MSASRGLPSLKSLCVPIASRRQEPGQDADVGTVDEPKPQQIRVVMAADVDALAIHRRVRASFKHDRAVLLPRLRREHADETARVGSPQSVADRSESRLCLRLLEQRIAILESDEPEREYTLAVTPILRSLVRLGKQSRGTVFSSASSDSRTSPQSSVQRSGGSIAPNNNETGTSSCQRYDLVRAYLAEAKRYADIDVVEIVGPTTQCPACLIALETSSSTDSEVSSSSCSGASQCPTCGYERDMFVQPKAPDEAGSHHYAYQKDDAYDAKENFLLELAYLQGKKVKPPLSDSLFTRLDRYFALLNMPTGAQVRMMPLNADERTRGTTSKDMMCTALSAIGCDSELVKQVNHICRCYWSWQLPDLSHLEQPVTSDYDDVQYVLKRFPDERKSSLNVRFLLKHLLLRHGYVCNDDDSQSLDTEGIRVYHRDRIAFAFAQLGWSSCEEKRSRTT